MVGWHHQLRGHEFEQTLGDGEGQGGHSPWGRKESDMTEGLNNNKKSFKKKKNHGGRMRTCQRDTEANTGAISPYFLWRNHLFPTLGLFSSGG